MDEKPKRRVNWRNVLLLCCLQFPLWYYASGFITPPNDAPRVTSPEGRALFRGFMHRYFPSLTANAGVKK